MVIEACKGREEVVEGRDQKAELYTLDGRVIKLLSHGVAHVLVVVLPNGHGLAKSRRARLSKAELGLRAHDWSLYFW